MWLSCGDRRISLSHTSSTYVIAKEPADLPPCDADIVFTIDGTRYERPIKLINGMTSSSREAAVASRDHIAPF